MYSILGKSDKDTLPSQSALQTKTWRGSLSHRNRYYWYDFLITSKKIKHYLEALDRFANAIFSYKIWPNHVLDPAQILRVELSMDLPLHLIGKLSSAILSSLIWKLYWNLITLFLATSRNHEILTTRRGFNWEPPHINYKNKNTESHQMRQVNKLEGS